VVSNGSLSLHPEQPTESSAARQSSRGARSRLGGRFAGQRWRHAATSAIWVVLLVGLIALTVWHALRSEALAEARVAYEGRPVDADHPSTTWWQRIWPDARSPGGSRRRRADANRPPQPDYVRALQRALDHLENHPRDGESARLAALCLSHLDYAGQAESYYRIARGAVQYSLDDLHIRALGLARANLRDEAIAAYLEILERWIDDPLALQRLAAVYYSRAQYQETLKVASRLAQATDPKWAVAGYSLIGTVHHDQHHFDLAVEANKAVLERDPELKLLTVPGELFWADFAEDLIETGRAADARRYLQRALQSGDDPALVNLLGAAYYAEGDETDAEQCWKHATAIDPRFDRPWLNLGKLAMRRGRLAEAASAFETAHAIDSQAFEALYQLSLIYRRLGRVQDAEQFGKKAAQVMRQKIGSSGSPRAGFGGDPR
jgi:tetratricopeptide (TPR) repeat protein